MPPGIMFASKPTWAALTPGGLPCTPRVCCTGSVLAVRRGPPPRLPTDGADVGPRFEELKAGIARGASSTPWGTGGIRDSFAPPPPPLRYPVTAVTPTLVVDEFGRLTRWPSGRALLLLLLPAAGRGWGPGGPFCTACGCTTTTPVLLGPPAVVLLAAVPSCPAAAATEPRKGRVG
jgi:hypothetical protein